MKLRHITFKNIKEHPLKIALLIVSLTVGVAVVVSLYSISRAMDADLQNKIDEYGANLVVVPKSKSLSLSYAGITVGGLQYGSSSLDLQDAAKIRTIKNSANIKVVAPKLLGIASLKGQKVIIAGIRFRDEFTLKKWWELRSGVQPTGSKDALLGGKIARHFGLKIGDYIDIKGNQFKVVGILNQVGAQEDELVYIDLNQAQKIMGKPGEISLIEVSAWCKDCPIIDIAEQISEKIPTGKVSAVRQAAEARDAVVSQFTMFSIILSVMMAVVASLIVFANVLSTVRERRREIGILRAIGYRQTHILYVILLEVGAAGLFSGLAGYLIGFFGSNAIALAAAGIDVGIKFDPVFAAVTVGGALATSLTASLYPAIFAARLNPSEAINAV
ncbi:MAG: FtsX-like permease family protein [Actinomycetota bacterium]